MSEATLKVLIVSAAGMGNVGDNILSMVSEELFVSLARAETRHASLIFKREEVEWADLVVVGGGGVFYDWSKDNVNNYLRFIEHAHYMGKKAVVLGVGTQGIRTDYGRRRYREVLDLTDLIIVRDEEDARVLSDEVGVRQPVHATQDLALLLPGLLSSIQERYDFQTVPQFMELRDKKSTFGKPLLGISMASEVGAALDKHQSTDMTIRQDVDGKKVKLIQELAKRYQPVLYIQSRDDRDFYDSIVKKIPSTCVVDAVGRTESLSILDFYRLFDAVVTSRYHGMVAALLTGKPVVLLGGVNSEKIHRTVRSAVPSLKTNIVAAEAVDGLAKKDIVQDFSLTEAQTQDVNTAIISAKETTEYLKSFLYGLRNAA